MSRHKVNAVLYFLVSKVTFDKTRIFSTTSIVFAEGLTSSGKAIIFQTFGFP